MSAIETGEGTQNAELIRKLYKAVSRKDIETIQAYGCEESEWLDVPFDFPAVGLARLSAERRSRS